MQLAGFGLLLIWFEDLCMILVLHSLSGLWLGLICLWFLRMLKLKISLQLLFTVGIFGNIEFCRFLKRHNPISKVIHDSCKLIQECKGSRAPLTVGVESSNTSLWTLPNKGVIKSNLMVLFLKREKNLEWVLSCDMRRVIFCMHWQNRVDVGWLLLWNGRQQG